MTTDTSSKDQGKSKTKGLKDQALAIWFMLDLTQELGDLLGHRNTLDHGHIKCV